MSEDLVFYTNPESRGRMVRWMLEEVGVPYKTELLDYDDGLKSAEYLAINPMGKVPAIKHGDVVVTECAAICAYLADAFPDAGLAPPITDRGAYYRWLFFAAGPVEAAAIDVALGVKIQPEQERMVGYGTFDQTFKTLEQAVSIDGYIAGDQFSAADLYVGAHIGWGLQFGWIQSNVAFEAYWARVSDRDAYRRATEIDDAAASAASSD